MKRVQIVPEARADLRKIERWISTNNPPAAVQYLEGIYKAFRYLADWPMSGRAETISVPAYDPSSTGSI